MFSEMTHIGPRLSETDITQVEARVGWSLPEAYRVFLLIFNGGRPEPSDFSVPQWHYQASLVNDFSGIIPGRYNDIEKNIEILGYRLPNGFIPIADDPGGNAILLSLHGPTRGKVYFWDHENEPNEYTDDVRDYPNIYLVADDFISFLHMLRDADEPEPSNPDRT